MSTSTRHRWCKLRVHVYICRKCGAGKVNAQDPKTGEWFATFHLPDGRSVRATHVPACEVGPLTDKFLGKYVDALAVPF
jgi:hypothetical protein